MMMPLWLRLVAARAALPMAPSRYRIAWQDPDAPEAPVHITIPDPNWMAAALHGGVLPAVEFYAHPNVVSDRAIGPMSEEQAIEYLIKKDIPPRVWRDYRGNREILKVIRVDAVPTDRSARNQWQIEDFDKIAM